jgi:hypothetical protein
MFFYYFPALWQFSSALLPTVPNIFPCRCPQRGKMFNVVAYYAVATQRRITKRKCHITSVLFNVYVQNVHVTQRKPSLNVKRHRR